MHGYSTDPAELAEAAKALDDGAAEVDGALSELTQDVGALGPGDLDAAADALLGEQTGLVREIHRDLRTSAESAREVGERYLRLEDDVREDLRRADGGGVS